MGVKGDFDELRKIWPNLSTPLKIFLTVSFILSCLSITSIANAIFQFRGFIEAAVDFHQSYITPILYYLLSLLGVELSQIKLDAILCISLLFSSLIHSNTCLKTYPVSVDYLGWFLYLVLILVDKLSDSAVYMSVYAAYAVVFMRAAIPYIFQNLKPPSLYKSSQIAALNIFSVLMCVGFLAAASEGINRTL
jgi:hypothetical protein